MAGIPPEQIIGMVQEQRPRTVDAIACCTRTSMIVTGYDRVYGAALDWLQRKHPHLLDVAYNIMYRPSNGDIIEAAKVDRGHLKQLRTLAKHRTRAQGRQLAELIQNFDRLRRCSRCPEHLFSPELIMQEDPALCRYCIDELRGIDRLRAEPAAA